MDLDRFKALAEAYGGDLRRWPEATRAEAARFSADHPEAQAVLAAEADFDQLLHAAKAEPASAALREAIIASAAARGAPFARRPRWSWKVWASGAGLAATAAAGALAGAVWISAAAGDMRTESLLAAAAPEDGAAMASWLTEGDT